MIKASEKILDLQERTLRIMSGGGKKAIEKQHREKKLTARERLEKILDVGTFREMDIFVSHRCTNFNMFNKDIPSEGVITGYGKIDNRLVYLFAQDFT
ncbi:MAG: methylmalonyl-CoA carboxyltransferase, partial [Firmicutes bacterium HGW-Firmicutes-12]